MLKELQGSRSKRVFNNRVHLDSIAFNVDTGKEEIGGQMYYGGGDRKKPELVGLRQVIRAGDRKLVRAEVIWRMGGDTDNLIRCGTMQYSEQHQELALFDKTKFRLDSREQLALLVTGGKNSRMSAKAVNKIFEWLKQLKKTYDKKGMPIKA